MDTQTPQASGAVKESKYLWLLIALLVLAVLIPIHKELGIESTVGEGHVLSALLVVVLIAGVRSICRSSLLRVVGTVLWIGGFLFHILLPATHVHDVLFMLGLILLTWLILMDLFDEGVGITRDRLRGAACAYLLMGIAWATAYSALNAWCGAEAPAFALGGTPQQLPDQDSRLVYYSFVTLTTLGYGDIAPVRPLATTLAWMQALAGQFYLTVLVAVLVGRRLAAWMAGSKD